MAVCRIRIRFIRIWIQPKIGIRIRNSRILYPVWSFKLFFTTVEMFSLCASSGSVFRIRIHQAVEYESERHVDMKNELPYSLCRADGCCGEDGGPSDGEPCPGLSAPVHLSPQVTYRPGYLVLHLHPSRRGRPPGLKASFWLLSSALPLSPWER